MSVLTTCIRAALDKKKIIFFGAGQYSLSTIKNLHPRIAYFCDNAPSKHGTDFHGIPVCPSDKLYEEDRQNTVVIINTEYYQEIATRLLDAGFMHIYCAEYENGNEPISVAGDGITTRNFLEKKAKAISLTASTEKVRTLLSDDVSTRTFDGVLDKYARGDFDFTDIRTDDAMYFNALLSGDLKRDETYVDAGAYDGKTLVDFIFFVNGAYRKIYAFEPDMAGYIQLCREFSDLKDLTIYQAALSNNDGEAVFDMRGTASSKIVDTKADFGRYARIKTMTLDSCVSEPVTLIKMDIEGGEYNALLGAREMIAKQKPKLAISVYHNNDDLVKIPLLIYEMVPEYKFYLRHHTSTFNDTVLYAML